MKIKFLVQIMIPIVSMCYVIGTSIAAEPRNELSMNSHKTIRVKEKEGVIPRTVTLKPGETVKWVNLSLSEIEIHFIDEKIIDAENSLHESHKDLKEFNYLKDEASHLDGLDFRVCWHNKTNSSNTLFYLSGWHI